MEENKNNIETEVPNYSNVIIKLLQGIIYKEDKELWNLLNLNYNDIYDYFKIIGLIVVLKSDDGYCYLKQNPEVENLYKLVTTTKLTYGASLLAIILREYLMEFEFTNSLNFKCIIKYEDITERIQIFFPIESNQIRQLKDFDRFINQLIHAELLNEIKIDSSNLIERKFEIKRIIKDKISIEDLNQFKEELKNGK